MPRWKGWVTDSTRRRKCLDNNYNVCYTSNGIFTNRVTKLWGADRLPINVQRFAECYYTKQRRTRCLPLSPFCRDCRWFSSSVSLEDDRGESQTNNIVDNHYGPRFDDYRRKEKTEVSTTVTDGSTVFDTMGMTTV